MNLELCNRHLQALFRAIERGDVAAVSQIEHRLTPEEECVVCAYALKARGVVREVIDTFLQKEGFMVAIPHHFNVLEELKFWFVRLGLLVSLLIVSIGGGTTFKTWVLAAKQATFLGGFGMGGAVLFATAAFIFIENRFLED